MTNVLLRDKRGETEDSTESGIRVMLMKDVWSHGKLEEAKKDFYLVSEGAQPHQHLDFCLLDSTMVREQNLWF